MGHLEPPEVQVLSAREGYEVRVRLREIIDDGVGFEQGRPSEGEGLKNMKDRSQQIGAEWVLNTGPGGTQVLIKGNFPTRKKYLFV